MKMEIEKVKSSYAVNVPFELKDDFRSEMGYCEWLPDLKKWKVGPSKHAALVEWVDENQEKAIELYEVARVLKEKIEFEDTLELNVSEIESVKVGKTDVCDKNIAVRRIYDEEAYEAHETVKIVKGNVSIVLEDGNTLDVVVERPLQNHYKEYTSVDFEFERGVVKHDLSRFKELALEAFENRVAALVNKWNQPRQQRSSFRRRW